MGEMDEMPKLSLAVLLDSQPLRPARCLPLDTQTPG